MVLPLVIIADLNVIGITIDKAKANTPLTIDRDGVLSLPVALECVQPISRGHREIIKGGCQVNVLQLSRRSWRHVGREALGGSREKQVSRTPIRVPPGYPSSSSETR